MRRWDARAGVCIGELDDAEAGGAGREIADGDGVAAEFDGPWVEGDGFGGGAGCGEGDARAGGAGEERAARGEFRFGGAGAARDAAAEKTRRYREEMRRVAEALDVYTRNPLLRHSLRLMRGPARLAPGRHALRYDFVYDAPGYAKGGTVRLSVDGRAVGAQHLPASPPALFTIDETFDVGIDRGSPVGGYPASAAPGYALQGAEAEEVVVETR